MKWDKQRVHLAACTEKVDEVQLVMSKHHLPTYKNQIVKLTREKRRRFLKGSVEI